MKRFKTRVKPFVAVLVGRAGAGLLLINLLVILLAGLSLRDSYLHYHERAAVTSQNLATLLSLEIRGESDSIDLALRTITTEAQRQMAEGGIEPNSFLAFLRRQQERHPLLSALRVTNSEGFSLYSADIDPHENPFSIGDRAYFIECRDRNDGLVISPPVFGRLTHQWAIMFARKIRAPDGSFAGIVFAALPVQHFTDMFATLVLGHAGAVSLRDGKLGLVARYPAFAGDAGAAQSAMVSDTFIKTVAASPANGIYEAAVPIDGVRRMNAYRRVGDYPFYVVVGLSTEEYLQQWRQEATKIGGVVVLFILMTLTGAWFLFSAWRARTQAHEQLHASKAELERFTEILARHLQEPVRQQYSFAQRLNGLLPQPVAPELQQSVDFILRGATRLRSLIHDAQLYLALDQVQAVSGSCPAARALDHAAQRLHGKILATAAAVTHGPLPTVAMDEKRLSDVFSALLDNALEYRRPHLPPQIEVCAERQGEVVMLSVSDNGIGIPVAFQTRVFKVFERLNGGEHLGTGIGLAVAKKIIEAAEGRIWIESVPEVGTRVCFTLPSAEE